MDSITQAVLGASIGEALLGKKIGSKGAWTGAIVATIPDLDVMLGLFYSKFEMLSIHRGFSHSFVFAGIGAIIVGMILIKLKGFRSLKWREVLLFTWLCLLTHILLDAFTAYGTQLLMPFSDMRLGLDSINVVDPLYTFPLLVGLLLSVWIFRKNRKRAVFNKVGIVVSSLYLVFTLINKQQVGGRIAQAFAKYEIPYNSLLTMPVGIANVNWYGVAKSNDTLYMLKYSVLKGVEGGIESFPINDAYLNEVDEEVAERMRWFAKGFYTVDKVNEAIRIYNLQVDMRGIIDDGGKKAPTHGYFEVTINNGVSQFSSGTIEMEK